MAEIQVRQLSRSKQGWVFEVAVIEGTSRTVHEVALSQGDFAKLAGEKTSAAHLVKASFEFLLEREDKESILTQFDLSVISRYFPEYPKKIGSYLHEKKPAQ